MDTQTDLLDRALMRRDDDTARAIADDGVNPSPEVVVFVNEVYPEMFNLVGPGDDIELTQDELNRGLKNAVISDNPKAIKFFADSGATAQPSTVDLSLEHADERVVETIIDMTPVTLMNLVSAVLHGRQQAAYRIARGYYNMQQKQIRDSIDKDDYKSLCEHLPNLDVHDTLLLAVYEGSVGCVKELINNNARPTLDMLTIANDRGYTEIAEFLRGHIR